MREAACVVASDHRLMNTIDSLRLFSQRRSRTQVLCAQCVRCDVSSDRIALRFALCVMTQQNATFSGVAHPGGGLWPQNSNSAEIVVQCTYNPPSFVIPSLVVRKLSCCHTNPQTHPQTNRRRRKDPTFFATLRRWMITSIIFVFEN